jgi:hypothetical protein
MLLNGGAGALPGVRSTDRCGEHGSRKEKALFHVRTPLFEVSLVGAIAQETSVVTPPLQAYSTDRATARHAREFRLLPHKLG